MLNDHISQFIDWIKAKNYEKIHYRKLANNAIKLSKYTHLFVYQELLMVKDKFGKDGFYKAVRALCNYFEEQYLDNEGILREIAKIRKIAHKPHCGVDIYTPSDEELVRNLEQLKVSSNKYYLFYLGLIFSGIRIREMISYVKEPHRFKIIQNEKYYKVVLNSDRITKKCYFVYLPNWFEVPKEVTETGLIGFLAKHKNILRPKYIRNWFYSKCLDLGIPNGVIDFYQGRSPVSVGNKHYLDKEKMGDRLYGEKLEGYFIKFLKENLNLKLNDFF